jgi:hypothetical protein
MKSINSMGIGNYPVNEKKSTWVLKHNTWIKVSISTPQGDDKLRINNSLNNNNLKIEFDKVDEIIEENDKLYNDMKSIHPIKVSVPYSIGDNNDFKKSNLHLYIIGDKLVGKKSLKNFIENVNKMITKRIENINNCIELIISVHNNDDIPEDMLIKDDTSKWLLFMYDISNDKSLETIVKVN